MDEKVVPIRRRAPKNHEERVIDWFDRYSCYLERLESGLLSSEEMIVQGVELRAEALKIKRQNC